MQQILVPNSILQSRYQIIRLLGQGGFGAVYLANDLRLVGRTVAVKENFDNSTYAQNQFQIEAALLANLSHSALPRVTDYFIEPTGRQYLVMDYVEGDDLEQVVIQRHRIPVMEAVAWMNEILDALDYLHTRQPPIIHRDLKPANIKVGPNGRAMLVDFGIAKQYNPSQKTQLGARAVSPGFSPNEQYGSAMTDARSDVYSLGATLYYLITGQTPPEAPEIATGTPITSPSRLGVPLTLAMEQAIMKAMAVQPQYRFQTAREFRMALNAPSPSYTNPAHTVAIAPTAVASPNVAASALPTARPISPPAKVPAQPGATGLSNVQYASWGRRVAAFLLDILFLSIVLFAVVLCGQILDLAFNTGYTSTSTSSSSSTGAFQTLGMCIFYIIAPLYAIVLHTRSGQTLGKKVFGIKVVNPMTEKPPSFGSSLMRGVMFFIESLLCNVLFVGFLGFLWPLWDQRKQAWHDKTANTIVIRV